jgi:hypothetical protein
MSRFSTVALTWVLAIGFAVGLGIYRGELLPAPPAPPPTVVAQQLDKVIACKAREDAERLAVAFNKTNELTEALDDPKSEVSGISRRLLLAGRCANFEHQVKFEPIGMAFDGQSFAPVLENPFNVIEADVALVKGSERFFLVTEWRYEPARPSKPAILPL